MSRLIREASPFPPKKPFMGSSPVPADQAARAKRRILVAASLVCRLTLLDSNIVAVSLPSIARTLGAGFADIEWVICAYVLSFAAPLLAAGSYADRHGRKRTTYERGNGKGKKAKTNKQTFWCIRADVVRKLDRGEREPETALPAPF